MVWCCPASRPDDCASAASRAVRSKQTFPRVFFFQAKSLCVIESLDERLVLVTAWDLNINGVFLH